MLQEFCAVNMYPCKSIVNDPVIIQAQGFRGEYGQFIPKEIAIISVLGVHSELLLFRPPCSLQSLPESSQKTNGWLMRNFHHIEWNCGDYDPNQLETILKSKVSKYKSIITKGEDMAKFFSGILGRHVFDANQILLKSLDSLPEVEFTCFHKGQCAFKNALKIKRWIKETLHVLTSVETL